jgi:hypothetical protein
LAECLEANCFSTCAERDAAAELRRLHEENETLKKCLFQMQNAAIELAKPEQEPEIVRRVRRYAGKRREAVGSPHINAKECIALANWIDSIFTAPPRKEWVGLTDEERDELLNYSTRVPSRLIDWVEQKLKEKNSD